MGKQLKSGHFNIFPLLTFIAENPVMPSGKGEYSNKFRKVINNLTKDILQNRQGWYLWGRFNEVGWWETIYLGKAGNQKTSSLRTRLNDELIEESVAFWAFVYGREVASKQKSSIFRGKYDKQTQRSLRKMYSQFIIWVELEEKLSENEIKDQEAILIKMYRPTHNASRPKCAEPTQLTRDIEKEIERQIREIGRIKPK